jgi:hypothetical protein
MDELKSGVREFLKQDPTMCGGVPTPAEANDALSGLALSQAINSRKSFAAMVFFAVITVASSREISATGSKSSTTSYGSV